MPTKFAILLSALGACALVVLSLSYPGSGEAERAGIPAETRANVSPENDFAAHVAALKKKLPSDDFSIIVQPPFVVVGDESEAAVQEHSERTVKWAVDKLKQDYFSKDPNEILDIWLFKDAASYETR